ncbi:hypothetical protein A2U01_0061269, partial [Trifolium medium]|nr:hypothetical protein [Trifolium medium]
PAVESRNVVAPKIDFRIQFTMGRKFDERGQMLTWVSDLDYSLGFVSVIAKSDNGANLLGYGPTASCILLIPPQIGSSHLMLG